MPCWYYSKKELKNTPSFRDGIDIATETRYRREGARFIIDTGTKMGLRYDTCATGVVYFHRFYMFHSFREFHRYVTSACCLFLAGKVEETPKKCKDIIKIFHTMLTDNQFMVFGQDPKEEIMTLERILLQTLKFDLQVEHPYAHLLKFAKIIKGDKAKVQKMVQMAWTFINDSLCTMLCLQWESDIVAVALIYLAGRLTKYDITDWVNKQPGQRVKWYEFLVEDVSLELLEDICHQVLDLYSPTQQKREDSPPPPPPPKPPTMAQSVTNTPTQTNVAPAKRPRSPPAGHPGQPGQPGPAKSSRVDRGRSKSPSKREAREKKVPAGANKPGSTHNTPGSTGGAPPGVPAQYSQGYTSNNPYVNTQMYSSSFMSTEGAQSIQTLVGNTPTPAAPAAMPYTAYNPALPPPVYSQPPPSVAAPVAPATAQPHTTTTQYAQPGAYQAPGYQAGYQAPTYPASQYQAPAQSGQQSAYPQQSTQQYQNTNYGSQQPPAAQTQYSQYGQQQYQQPQYTNQQQQPPPPQQQQQQQQPQQQQQQPPPQYGNQYHGNQQQQYGQGGAQPFSSYVNQNYSQPHSQAQPPQAYHPPPPGAQYPS